MTNLILSLARGFYSYSRSINDTARERFYKCYNATFVTAIKACNEFSRVVLVYPVDNVTIAPLHVVLLSRVARNFHPNTMISRRIPRMIRDNALIVTDLSNLHKNGSILAGALEHVKNYNTRDFAFARVMRDTSKIFM